MVLGSIEIVSVCLPVSVYLFYQWTQLQVFIDEYQSLFVAIDSKQKMFFS